MRIGGPLVLAAALVVPVCEALASTHDVVPPGDPAPPTAPSAEAGPDDATAAACRPPQHMEVLFIGNSYTLMHDLPGLVGALGDQAGLEIEVHKLATGGKNFEYHLHREQTERILADGHFDVVVLQSHSLDPLRNREGFLGAGEELVEMVRDAGAEPILLETWARRSGHNLYGYFDPAGGTPGSMTRAVHEGYQELARRVNARVAEVGHAWRRLRKREPDIVLHARDGNHPGRHGAYLTATVLFAVLTNLDPVEPLQPLMGIDPEDARVLREHAAAVVQPACSGV